MLLDHLLLNKPNNKFMPKNHQVFSGGWLPQFPDHRDRKYTLQKETGVQSVYLASKYNLGHVFDQGQLGSCFVGETKIPLLNGQTKTLKELHEAGKQFWVYSIDKEGKVVPGKAVANKTGLNKKVIKIILDNEEEIICTPDHEFLLRNGRYKKAKNLKDTDSLMPLYRKPNKGGYEMTMSFNDNRYHLTHWLVAGSLFFDRIDELREEGKTVVIHHRDFNKRNNYPSNLHPMDNVLHTKFHRRLAANHDSSYWGSEKQSIDSTRTIKKQYEDNPLWNREASLRGLTESQRVFREDPEKRENMLRGLESGRTPEVRKKVGALNKFNFENDYEYRIRKFRGVKKGLKTLFSNPESVEALRNSGINVGTNSGRYKVIIWAKELLDQGIEINEENWNKRKKESSVHNFSKFKTAIKYFDSIEEMTETAKCYNHKIVSIEKLKEKRGVYCLSVDEYHNFALEAGVFVHNCVSNSVGFLVYFDLLNKQEVTKVAPFAPSRLFIYYYGRLLEGDPLDQDTGLQIRSGIKVINQQGAPSEDLWPYDINKFAQKPNQVAITQAAKFLSIEYKSIDNTNKQLLIAALQEGFPIAFGMTVYESFMTDRVASTGIVPMPALTEKTVGGHALAIVGYRLEDDSFIIRNSWGSDWGQSGYCRIKSDYICNPDLASDFWIITSIQ